MNVDCCFYSLHIVQLVNEGVSDHPLLMSFVLYYLVSLWNEFADHKSMWDNKKLFSFIF